MKSMKHPKTKTNNLVKFKGIEELYFPSVCVVCGKDTENRVKKNHYGSYYGIKDTRKDYFFNIPVCEDCEANVNLKTGLESKSGKILLFGLVMGLILSIVFYFFF